MLGVEEIVLRCVNDIQRFRVYDAVMLLFSLIASSLRLPLPVTRLTADRCFVARAAPIGAVTGG